MRDLAAGDFSSWIGEMQAAIESDGSSNVPCNGCTACCRSSQFVHIGPDETDTLSRIPAELRFPAPRMPRGHVLLGYDERGHCPMLIDDKCSIYEHRPQACRTYDCRIFAAAGIEPEADKPEIADRTRRWEFTYPDHSGRQQHDAVRAAATFLGEHEQMVRDAGFPTSQTQLAGLAVEIHDLFTTGPVDAETVRAELARRSRSGPET